MRALKRDKIIVNIRHSDKLACVTACEGCGVGGLDHSVKTSTWKKGEILKNIKGKITSSFSLLWDFGKPKFYCDHVRLPYTLSGCHLCYRNHFLVLS